MTSPPPLPRPQEGGLGWLFVREILALALIVLGFVAILAAAFLTDPRLGVAALGATLLTGGVALGLDR